MKFIELFAGIGGFRYGLESCNEHKKRISTRQHISSRRNSTNFNKRNEKRRRDNPMYRCVWANDNDKYACQIYKKNFGKGVLHEGDIKTVDAGNIPDHDLLTGGFPCQSFSITGKRKGFEDTRGTLFFDIARILDTKKPRMLLLENVKGLLSHDNGNTFRTILWILHELGYDIQWQVLNSKDFGVPQNRERVFIIGHLRGTRRPEIFPFQKYFVKKEKYNEKINQKNFKIKTKEYLTNSNQWNVVYELDGIAPTLTTFEIAIPLLYFDEYKIRRMTPIEIERCQGFPDNWTKGVNDKQRYIILGNAVMPNIIMKIGKRLKW